MHIPEFVVEELQLERVLEPLLVHLRSIMTVGRKVPELRTHNIVFVPVGSKEQVGRMSLIRFMFSTVPCSTAGCGVS